jgi:hypothetical protein
MFSVPTATLTICLWGAADAEGKAIHERAKASRSAGSRLNLDMERGFLSRRTSGISGEVEPCRASPSGTIERDKFRAGYPRLRLAAA